MNELILELVKNSFVKIAHGNTLLILAPYNSILKDIEDTYDSLTLREVMNGEFMQTGIFDYVSMDDRKAELEQASIED